MTATTEASTRPRASAPGIRERIGRSSQRLSARVAWAERGLVMFFIAAIFALILLNVVTRAGGRPLVWVDEAAICLMVMACFVGTSLTVRQRLDFAMTLVLDRLDERQRRWSNRLLSLVGLAYALFVLWCCWRMFDPLGLARSGFDLAKFTAGTMNFLYAEPTQTLGIPKWIVYLVLPVYGIGLSIHTFANLCEDLGWARVGGAPPDGALTIEAG